MVKLLVLDLDGTLLDDEKRLNPCDRDAVREVKERGIEVTVFTGRNYHSARPYVEELGVGVPVVFQNGAFILDFGSGEILREVLLRGEVAKEIVIRAREEGLFYIVYRDFRSEKDMLLDREYGGAYGYYLDHNEWRIVRVEDVLKVIGDHVAEVALIGNDERVRRVARDLEDVSVIKSTQIGDESFWEIFGPGCSKAIALEFLLDHFGVSSDEVMFIGDGFNDLEMMKMVGLPVAMGNAPSQVKEHAKFVTLDNNSCGVAHAIKELILSV